MSANFKSMYKLPIDLISEWGASNPYYYTDSNNDWKYEKYFCGEGARWGAKQELGACCAQISQCHLIPKDLRTQVADYLHETRMKAFTIPNLDKPLIQTVIEELNLSDSIRPEKLASLLELIAEFVEHRGFNDFDQDPGETADWLREEARESHVLHP